ncbi:NUBPL iron-transfer P-loop NTPase [Ordospora pajunii]|jgi:Mrp family chromosome partitioning ATPase|uniref:NUBPL iron-transfer P-loop NTPase n=1 Tax=Ordospora pajunii TaxID=3039483 RepID=UPI0029526573|nr:NUBPL iron-transfer P-loop NTPase [Ordospora pajunii]KAH9410643.1 NUBPL iron-transfer P-loop NTPase [Ordospora pajunii]
MDKSYSDTSKHSCPGTSSRDAGKLDGCKECPNASQCAQPRQLDPDILFIQQRLHDVKAVVAVMSGKGGVGKSTITRNIAEALSLMSIRTCVLDLDLSGPNIPKLTGTNDQVMCEVNSSIRPIRVNEFLSIVSIAYLEESEDQGTVFSSNLKTGIVKKLLKCCDYKDIEVLLIDTPPNVTDEHLGMVEFIKPRHAILVSTPQRFSLQDVVRQIGFCRKTGIRIIGVVENMRRFVCASCNHEAEVFNSVDVQKYCIECGLEYIGSIGLKQSIAKQSDLGMPVQEEIFRKLAYIIVSTCLESNQTAKSSS